MFQTARARVAAAERPDDRLQGNQQAQAQPQADQPQHVGRRRRQAVQPRELPREALGQ